MLFKITCLLFLTLLGFAVNAATYFEEGAASQGSQHLVNSAKQLDAQTITDYQDCIRPCLKPIYAQLRDVDKNRQATTGDIEAIFKTILILNYHDLFNIAEFSADDPCLREQFLAYKIMGVTCGVLMQEQMSLLDLQQRSLEEVRKDKTFDILTDSYVKSLIPDNVHDLVQYPELTEIQYRNAFGGTENYKEKQTGTLLGKYDKEQTLKNLQKEKEGGKEIYLVIGRGNRQLAPADQKTAAGKEIVWVYLDNTASCHCTNRSDYFLWEDFNGTLSRKIPEAFFDGVIFDRSVTKFIDDKLLTVIQITKILASDGFLFFPIEGYQLPLLYPDFKDTYVFPFGSNEKHGRLLWPGLNTGYSSMRGNHLRDKDLDLAREELYILIQTLFKKLFSLLFEEVSLLTNDNLGFKLSHEDSFREKNPKFKLLKPNKVAIQAKAWYKNYYDS